MNVRTSHHFHDFAASQQFPICASSHSEFISIQAMQVGKLKDKAAKGRQVHLLCASLVELLGQVK